MNVVSLRREMRFVVLESKRAIEARGNQNRELLFGPVMNDKLLDTKRFKNEKQPENENENEKRPEKASGSVIHHFDMVNILTVYLEMLR